MSDFIKRKFKEAAGNLGEAATGDKGVSKDLTTILKMSKSYFIQETLSPLRKIKHKILYALAGSLLIGTGFFLLLLALLRVLQTETGSVFQGNESFAPYLITFIVGAFFAVCIALYAMHSFKDKK